MIIQGYDLPLVAHPDVKAPVYPHQAAMIDDWRDHEAFLLTSKTGSGKTAAWVVSYLAHRHLPDERNAVCVYPTNELIKDQERSIYDLIVNKQGLTCHIWSQEDTPYTPTDVELIRIDADALDSYIKVWRRSGVKTKGQALLRLLQTDRPRVILTNPDTLYLLFALRYSQSAEALGTLQAYRTVVFDEFHVYTGIELAHALFMVHMARELDTFKRFVLLSATPHPQVRSHIERLLSPHTIDVATQTGHPIVGSRRVTHDLELKAQHVPTNEAGGVVSGVRELLRDLKPQLEQLRDQHLSDPTYVPAVIILNSVVSAIDLEDVLRDVGFGQDEIVPMRGLVARSERQLNPRQLLVIGTSAVEVGVDFRTDYLLFQASDAASFMQRLGRAGRHGPGIVYLFGDARECRALASFAEVIGRTEFEQGVLAYYPQADARAWFVETVLGTFTTMIQGGSILSRIDKGRRREFEDKDRIRDWVISMTERFAERMGTKAFLGQARGLYRLRHSDTHKWVADYERLDGFRTSLPSVEVVDRADQRRGRVAFTYSVDIKTLLQRAHDLHRDGRQYIIDGYERFHLVHINMNFRGMAEREGKLQSTRDQDFVGRLMLKRKTLEGNLDPVSHLMSLEDDPHVFVFVPKEIVEDDLDWRIATFDAGSHAPHYVVAFDGDALQLREIYRRATEDRKS